MTKFPTPPSTPAQELPRIERRLDPAEALFYASDGERFRVVDCVMISGRLRRIRLEAPRATCRVFLDRRGGMRYYGRQPREDWRLRPATLQRQLAASRPVSVALETDETELLP